MPDSISSFGVLSDEAASTTARRARITSTAPPRFTSTPVARPSSITTLRASARTSRQFGRFSAGRR